MTCPPACHLPPPWCQPRTAQTIQNVGFDQVVRSLGVPQFRNWQAVQEQDYPQGLASVGVAATRCTDSDGLHWKQPTPTDVRCGSSSENWERTGNRQSCDTDTHAASQYTASSSTDQASFQVWLWASRRC